MICSKCGSEELLKFKKKLQLCAKCYNIYWWKTYKDKDKYKEQRKANRDRYNKNNIELIKKRDRDRYEQNKEEFRLIKRSKAKYYNDIEKNRYKNDPLFKLKVNLRKRLYHAVKKNQKTGSALSDLGCSIEEFKVYLESKWKPGMTWDNYNFKGWHIDHIVPLDAFDLSDPEQVKKACHYTNLQPLWAVDNLRKGASL